jgi:2-hydroxy-3-keto-5-methylthiopentenyl-1-phosphate phosphatase
MELASSSVFVDFDGTITDVDTCVHLLDRLAPPEWREIEVLYDAGVIGSRECIAREWSLLAGDRSEIEAVSREVGIDEGLSALVEFLRSAGAEVTIVSDGFGLRVVEIAKWAGVGVMSNLVDWESGSVVFPNGDPSCECALCGECKRAPIRDARRRGRTTILVGDGASDIKAAAEADIVFAKNRLADWCEAQGLPFLRFSSLGEVHAALVDGVSARAPG